MSQSVNVKQTDLSFKVLQLLSKERGVYGLRNGDYERYRRHCANKLHRLRQVTGSTSGKGKVYKKPPVISEDTVKDVKHLQLLLFSAERALAHSHELKSIGTKPNPPHNTRRDQLSWLRRALKYSTSLYEISSTIKSGLSEASSSSTSTTTTSSGSKISQQTLAEITIYHLSIRAELSFEKQQWAEALTDLAGRRKLLATLSDAARDSYDQALAIEFMDQYDPLIRFSAYKLGRAESHDIEGVTKDVDDEMMEEAIPGLSNLVEALRGETNADEMDKGRKTLEQVEFAGEKVEIRNAELVGVMLRVQEAVGRLKGKADTGRGRGMKGWDSVLAVLGEAEGVARRLLDDHEASGSSTSLRSTKTTQSLTLAHQYIIYLLLSHRIRRDLLLADTMFSSTTSLSGDAASFKIPGGRVKVEEAVKGLAAIIKLYDAVLQSMSQLRSLAIVEEKEGVRASAEALEAYFHATRLYNLARLHCIHPASTYASAVQLLARASDLVHQARNSLSDGGADADTDMTPKEEVVPLSLKDVESLKSRISALDLAAKRALFAATTPKPVFFDTAFNYIDMPMDELLVLAGKSKAPSPKATTSSASGVTAAISSVLPKQPAVAVQAVAEKAEQVVEQVKKSVVVGREKTREATPAPESPGLGADGEKPKGWLGGWFGRK